MENHSLSPNTRRRAPMASSPLSPRYASRLRSRSGGSTGSSGSRRHTTPPLSSTSDRGGGGSRSSLKAMEASSPPRRRSPGGYSSRHIPSRVHLPSFGKNFENSFSSPMAPSGEPAADFSPAHSPLLSRAGRSSSKSSPYKRQRSPFLSPSLPHPPPPASASESTPAANRNRSLFPPMSPSSGSAASLPSSPPVRRSLSFGDPPPLTLPPVSSPLLNGGGGLGQSGDGSRRLPEAMKPFGPISIGPPLGALEFDAMAQHNAASHNTGGGGPHSPYRRLNFSAGPRDGTTAAGGAGGCGSGVFAPHSPCNPFARSPIDDVSFRMPVQAKRPRHIASQPYKILDAPDLKDDFYLNLVDWSSSNLLAVGLGSCLYLWSACNSKVIKLCDVDKPPSSLSSSTGDSREQRRRRRRDNVDRDGAGDYITSVAWAEKGPYLAIGTEQGQVQLWDVAHGGGKGKLLREFDGHDSRVGALAWNGRNLVSGSRDRHILMHDSRQSSSVNTKFLAHKQEVCGLKWSSDDERVLASGGNDNKLMLWDARKGQNPFQRFSEHTAAVKAIAWSPHTPGLLASGGGTADRCIRFWDTLSPQENSQKCVDTGSQVCNLAWSKNVDEIVSTHGYSLNQIVIWNAPSMTKVKTLTGHSYRVLYLAASPDGQTVVTGAGDETLRFWSVFPESPHRRASHNRRAIPFTISRGCEIR